MQRDAVKHEVPQETLHRLAHEHQVSDHLETIGGPIHRDDIP